MTGLVERITAPGQKRLLAIDGGGIRGVLALEILARIEEVLGKGRPEFRLSQYFDYIAGTSTGAIIAAGLARGMKAAEITAFYLDAGAHAVGIGSPLLRGADRDPTPRALDALTERARTLLDAVRAEEART